MVPFLLILAFVSYVTAADSNTEAIAQICRTHDGLPTEVDSKADDKELRMGKALKMVWVVLLAVTAWIMVAFSGIDGVRMLSNVGGLPALFIVIGLQLSLFRMMGQVSQLDGAHIKTVAAE
jgi:choline-glycine betaine transporter